MEASSEDEDWLCWRRRAKASEAASESSSSSSESQRSITEADFTLFAEVLSGVRGRFRASLSAAREASSALFIVFCLASLGTQRKLVKKPLSGK